MGRKTTYTQEIADSICDLLADGVPLREICRNDAMPSWRTVYDWKEADKAFAARIARAREVGYDAIAEEAMTIADTPVEGVETTVKPDGSVEERRGDMLGHRKLQIETRLKLLAKWSPKRYGDKMDVGLSGSVTILATPQDESL
jgi:hypothetical protein